MDRTLAKEHAYEVCDDCLTVAYDNGIYDPNAQERAMVQLGAIMEDHLCVTVEEPKLGIRCDCSCHKSKRVGNSPQTDSFLSSVLGGE